MGVREEVLLADQEVPVGRAGLEDSEVPEVLADLAGQVAQEGAPLAPPC